MSYEPFTYLIGWKEHDKWYYGVRYARNCHPDDLWTKYFTSSKEVKKFREECGEPDVIEVRQVFPTDTLLNVIIVKDISIKTIFQNIIGEKCKMKKQSKTEDKKT